MEVMDSLRAALKELILPELDRIKHENAEINAKLELTNKRLDDINLHLVDQSRRIDETNKRIDAIREELKLEIIETNKRIDETNKRIDETNKRIDETNTRLNRLYEVVVRRDEHSKIEARVAALERDVSDLKRQIAA